MCESWVCGHLGVHELRCVKTWVWENRVCEDPGHGNHVCLAFVVLHHTLVNLMRIQQTGLLRNEGPGPGPGSGVCPSP